MVKIQTQGGYRMTTEFWGQSPLAAQIVMEGMNLAKTGSRRGAGYRGRRHRYRYRGPPSSPRADKGVPRLIAQRDLEVLHLAGERLDAGPLAFAVRADSHAAEGREARFPSRDSIQANNDIGFGDPFLFWGATPILIHDAGEELDSRWDGGEEGGGRPVIEVKVGGGRGRQLPNEGGG